MGVNLKALTHLWTTLHSYRPDVWDPRIAYDWFIQWMRSIPDLDCGCMAHWRDLVNEFPVDTSSAESFFAWGVEAHNKVNKRLRKKIITLEEARKLWQT